MRMGRQEYDYNLPVRNRLSDQDMMSSMETTNSTVKEEEDVCAQQGVHGKA